MLKKADKMPFQSASNFLSSLRLAYPLMICDAYRFALHVYEISLNREPEFTAENMDSSLLSVRNAWDRCSYIEETFKSEEFIIKNPDYDQILDVFFSVLGYRASRKTLIVHMKHIYPSDCDFWDNISDILANISINTQRTYFGPSTADIVAEVDASEIVRLAIAAIPAIEDRCARIEADVRDLVRSVADLRSGLSDPAGPQPAQQDVLDLLLAIQAQLQMGAIR